SQHTVKHLPYYELPKSSFALFSHDEYRKTCPLFLFDRADQVLQLAHLTHKSLALTLTRQQSLHVAFDRRLIQTVTYLTSIHSVLPFSSLLLYVALLFPL